MTKQTPRYGCGVGKKLLECSPQERVPDAELWRRIAEGLQQAADAAMTLATRQEVAEIEPDLICDVCGKRAAYLVTINGRSTCRNCNERIKR